MEDVRINLNECVIPKFLPYLEDILDHRHVHYVFKGGRGSTKSSFISEAIPLILVENPSVHAVVFRKVGNTMKNSVWGQITWAIHQLGLDDYFSIPKTIANPIVFKPTKQQILFMGLDDPNKIKSIKLYNKFS